MTEGICPTCQKGFEVGQGKRFKTTKPMAAYHDDCWPFICCTECGGEGPEDCYCIQDGKA